MALTNIDWLPTLPQQFLINGYDEAPPRFKIRTEMDAAIAKQRPRFSTGAKQVTGQMVMTNSQYDLFIDFYENSLMMGSLEFNMPKRGDNTQTRVMRFTADEYDSEPVGIHWLVTLNLEEIP